MQYQQQSVLGKILPYIGMGIFFVLIIIAFVLLSYILLIGGIIGLILFAIAYIKAKFFSKNKGKGNIVSGKEHKGQVYDHRDAS